MPSRAQTTTVLRLGGWTAYLSGAVAAIGLLFWFARLVGEPVSGPGAGAERHLATTDLGR